MDSNTGGVPALILAHDGTETEVHISRDVRVTLRRVDGMLVVGVFTDPMPSPEHPDYFATYHNIPVHLSKSSLQRAVAPHVPRSVSKERTKARNVKMYQRRLDGASIDDLMLEFGLTRNSIKSLIYGGNAMDDYEEQKEARNAGGA
jgi:hypothetical protein